MAGLRRRRLVRAADVAIVVVVAPLRPVGRVGHLRPALARRGLRKPVVPATPQTSSSTASRNLDDYERLLLRLFFYATTSPRSVEITIVHATSGLWPGWTQQAGFLGWAWSVRSDLVLAAVCEVRLLRHRNMIRLPRLEVTRAREADRAATRHRVVIPLRPETTVSFQRMLRLWAVFRKARFCGFQTTFSAGKSVDVPV